MLRDVMVALSQVWDLFEEVQVPGLGISFASLWLGSFVVMVSIVILRPLLGIGAGASRLISGVGKRAISHRRRGSAPSEGSD